MDLVTAAAAAELSRPTGLTSLLTWNDCDDDRTEAVLRQLQQRAPVMSDAEKEALGELKDIQVLLSSYTSKITTV